MEFNLFPGFIRNNEWNAPVGDGHDCESRLPSLPGLRTSRICARRAGWNASGKGAGVKDYTGGEAPPVFIMNAAFPQTAAEPAANPRAAVSGTAVSAPPGHRRSPRPWNRRLPSACRSRRPKRRRCRLHLQS